MIGNGKKGWGRNSGGGWVKVGVGWGVGSKHFRRSIRKHTTVKAVREQLFDYSQICLKASSNFKRQIQRNFVPGLAL
jgi:hypothetical protein